MFLAVRDLRFARARFLLMGAVVALIATLSVVLTGLATGLVTDNVSGIRNLPASHVAFEGGDRAPSFSRSTIERKTWEAYRDRPGVREAAPLGNQIVHVQDDGGTELEVSLFGVPVDSSFAPPPLEGRPLGAEPDGVLVSQKLIDDGARVGGTLTVDRLGTKLPIIGSIGEHSFGHVGVAYVPLATWQRVHYGLPGPVPRSAYDQATSVALNLTASADPTAADRALGTQTVTLKEAYKASPGYSVETSTMLLIRVFLYLISALVVGAFFFVWTVQRGPEIALVKALGASSGYVGRDALAQVVIVLVLATGVGVLAGLGLGAAMPSSAPFSLEVVPVVSSALLLIGLGTLGALVALRRITAVDPLLALGSAR